MDTKTHEELLKIIKEENITDYKIEVGLCTSKGTNVSKELLAIVVTGGNNKTLHLICKSIPKDKEYREQFRMDVMFDKERFFYKQLMPLYENFQKEKGILDKDGFHNYPRCYSFVDTNLFTKDLRQDGFVLMDHSAEMDYKHAKIIFETIAKYHALGLAFKNQMPEEFNKYRKDLGVDLFAKPLNKLIIQSFTTSLKFAKNTLHNDEKVLKEKVDEIIKNVQNCFPTAAVGANSEPYATFAHGDFWLNNILFKYDNKENPIDVCFLDYQINRYSSPATDLSQFFFCCTNMDFRNKYYTKLLQDYHESLSNFLTKLGSPEKVFSISVLEEQMKQFGLYGVVISSVILKMISGKGMDLDQFFEVTKEEANVEDIITDVEACKSYKKQVGDVLRDAHRLGML